MTFEALLSVAGVRITVPVAIGLMCFCALEPSRASAQTVFVDSGVVQAYQLAPLTTLALGSEPSQVNLQGATFGFGVSAGVSLTPRLSARFEATWPGTIDRGVIGPTQTGISHGTQIRPSRTEVSISDRTSSFGPLLAFHTARRHRTELAFVGGASFSRHTRRSVTELVLLDGFDPKVRDVWTSDTASTADSHVAPVAGVEAEVAVAAHVSIVPKVRLRREAGMTVVGSYATVRWRWWRPNVTIARRRRYRASARWVARCLRLRTPAARRFCRRS